MSTESYRNWNSLNRKVKWKTVIAWIGVGITLIISSLWAFWGIVENFHEGWYSTSIWENLFIMFIQYLSFPIGFVVLSLIALTWPKVGLGLYISMAVFGGIFFAGAHFTVVHLMITIPLTGLGLLFFFGKLQKIPRKYAKLGIVVIPLLITVGAGIPGAIRVSQRVDDGNYGMRTIVGNGITLIWAPKGPGWPDTGFTWEEAMNQTRYLSENGTMLMNSPQDIWRIPTVDELVRSQCLHGENAGPLWDPHSHVIYYWTGTEVSDTHAYMIVYNGDVYSKDKRNGADYLNFRAVKNP